MIYDIASIIIIATFANHLGLVSAIEERVRHELPIVNCCKCLTFWCVLAYIVGSGQGIVKGAAISFVCAYGAIWLDLGMGIMDSVYMWIYSKINDYEQETTNTADADTTSATDENFNGQDAD